MKIHKDCIVIVDKEQKENLLKFFDPNINEGVVTEESEADLNKASYQVDISKTEMDATDGSFFTTVDKILFKGMPEVITKVLSANNYSLSLENILGCLDNLIFGIRAKILDKKDDEEKTVKVKTYSHCIQFQLPTKRKVGPLLKAFYDEIEKYETVIARYRGKVDPKKTGKEKTPAEMKTEIKELKTENAWLKQNIAELTRDMSKMKKSHMYASKALESQNLLPSNIRIGKVKSVQPDKRNIVIKTGSKTLHSPMTGLSELPAIGERCLINIEDGKVLSVFFYERKGVPFDVKIARVLYVDNNLMKVRDSGRKTWTLEAKNSYELELFDKTKRGAKILLYVHSDHVVKIESMLKSNTKIYSENVNRDIAIKDIQTTYINSLSIDEEEQ